MTSIYKQALGEEFEKLHPRIRERFEFNSDSGIASVGRGIMDSIWYSKRAMLPLQLGTMRHIMFPQGGKQIPFTIENYAYQDCFGRETVTWIRQFQFPNKKRHFDATMIYSKQHERIVDYLGTKQHLAVDLEISAATNGGLRIRSGEQRFYEHWLQFRFPTLLTGVADVCEWYDDESEKFKISVEVTNPLLGKVFEYQGSFQVEFIKISHATIPRYVFPLREEERE